jgi:hypothetical protein
MNLWYFIALPAWLIIIASATARLADLGRDQWETRHHVRRLGLIGLACMAAIMLYAPASEEAWRFLPGNWRSACIAWSFALVVMTTEGLPPWHEYITGKHRRTAEWPHMDRRRRVAAEFQALGQSFYPRRRKTDRPLEP